MKRLFPVSAVLVLATLSLLHTSCRKTSPYSGADSAKDIILSAAGLDLVSTGNQFSMDLFHALQTQDSLDGNVMISPFSVYMALAMTDNGAAGATQDSISNTLRLGSQSVTGLNNTAEALLTQLPAADKEISLSIANSAWLNQNIAFQSAFEQTVKTYYDAKTAAVDFGSPNAAASINQWVASATKQMIPSIIDATDPSYVFVLVNAIYFKGSWTYAFDANSTADAPFTLQTGATESVPMMTIPKGSNFRAMNNDSLTMVEFPYGGKHFSMYALLPGQLSNIHSLASALTLSNFNYWQSQLYSESIVPFFPRFDFSYGIKNMEPELKQMGMTLAFSDNADFSNMTGVPTTISQVAHKTAIQVDESGTVAAAATAVVGISLTIGNGPFPVRFDHPFLFVIQEKTSGAILFIGVVNDPLAKGN